MSSTSISASDDNVSAHAAAVGAVIAASNDPDSPTLASSATAAVTKAVLSGVPAAEIAEGAGVTPLEVIGLIGTTGKGSEQWPHVDEGLVAKANAIGTERRVVEAYRRSLTDEALDLLTTLEALGLNTSNLAQAFDTYRPTIESWRKKAHGHPTPRR